MTTPARKVPETAEHTPAIEAAAKALCRTWPKDPNGCAALCLDRLGSIPKEGCRHAAAVHGARATAVLTAAAYDDMLAALREVEAYFDDRADVDDGIPNEAMRLLVEVQTAIAKAKGE